MNCVLKKIIDLRKGKDIIIDTTNSNRYRVVVNEQNGTKTAYYFSTPIYNINTKKLVGLKFTDNITPRLAGSNSQICFSRNIKMSNANGICFISLRKHINRISDVELHEGENIILPTTNGFVYKILIKDSFMHSFNIKTNGIFLTTRSNDKYLALMIDKFTPFICVCAIGTEDSNGYISSPFKISQHKISDSEYVISASKTNNIGKYFVFEINMYEKKLIQDTTVESANPTINNVFGSSAYIGTTTEFGEQWLYSRIDYKQMSDIAGCRINHAIAYMPKLNKSMININAYKVSERFCSFGSTWDNKKTESNCINHSYGSDRYIIVDITNAIVHEKSKQISATNGIILKPTKKNDFVAITTGDSCFLPQIIAINYY